MKARKDRTKKNGWSIGNNNQISVLVVNLSEENLNSISSVISFIMNILKN